MKIKQINWYGFDHEAVARKFPGNPTYINDFPLTDKAGNDFVGAVYYVAKPDKKQGHKNYLILMQHGNGLFCVMGMTKREIKKFSTVDAIVCEKCGYVLYSVQRHHFHSCGCPNKAHIDGDNAYSIIGAKNLDKVSCVTLDLLAGTIEA